ncbi:MAG: aspartate carbamoyltransferase catalytic subunit [Patulibacter sp.]|nr:aspartate carbamoyltransferase catalytic subunit [Patulibacter sp.]
MKHLISIDELGRDDVELLLERAASFSEVANREIKKVPALRGRTVLTLFYEASTRTRSSFELAAKRLSADIVSFSAGGSSVEKGESLKDTVLTLAAHSPDAIVVRAPWAGTPQLVSQWTDAAIVNAGDGKREHPTQALLDLFTMRQQLGADLEGRSVWIVGDVAHSRVARSLIRILVLTGVHVTVCGPPTLIPKDIAALGCDVTFDMSGIHDADVVYTLRLQHERMTAAGLLPSLGEYAAQYQVNSARLSPNQGVMHPGPVNRGVEMSGEVVDSPQAVITMQVKAGVVVRMAVLYELLAGARSDVAAKERIHA